MSPEQEQRLRAFLSALPTTIAAPLAQAIERDRLAEAAGLPHDLILSGLRPILQAVLPPAQRIPTPLRLFCEPFEDLLVSGHERERQSGQIARSSLSPIWHWLREDLGGQTHQEICSRIAQAILSRRTGDLKSTLAELHAEAARSMGEVLDGAKPGSPAFKALERRLGSAHVIEDAREIRSIASVAPVLAKVSDLVPRHSGSLSDSDIAELRDLFEAAENTDPGAAHYVLLVTFRRLEHPWEILKVAKKISNQDAEFLLGGTEFGQIGKLLRDDLEHLANSINAVNLQDFDPEDLLRALRLYTDLSNGLIGELGARPDGPYGKQIMQSRQNVARRMERVLDTLAREIPAALPFVRGFNKHGPKRPDLSEWPDERKSEKACRAAELIDGCRDVASKAAFAVTLTETVSTLEEHLKDYGEGLVEALRGAEEEDRDRGEAFLEQTIEIATRLGNGSDAELLRRRAAVALRG